MHIQRPIAFTPSGGAVGIGDSFDSTGGNGGGYEGFRVEWTLRVNLSHQQGFVGGAARLLLHNERADERSEVVLFLPTGGTGPSDMQLLTASLCSVKPSMNVPTGQALPITAHGKRAAITIPVLRMGDWAFLDFTWSSAFAQGGASYPSGAVPLGDHHPQVATDITTKDGLKGLIPVSGRYEVVLNTDHGAKVRVDGQLLDDPVTAPGAESEEHTFKWQGGAAVNAIVLAPGTVVADRDPSIQGPSILSRPTPAPVPPPPADAPVASPAPAFEHWNA